MQGIVTDKSPRPCLATNLYARHSRFLLAFHNPECFIPFTMPGRCQKKVELRNYILGSTCKGLKPSLLGGFSIEGNEHATVHTEQARYHDNADDVSEDELVRPVRSKR